MPLNQRHRCCPNRRLRNLFWPQVIHPSPTPGQPVSDMDLREVDIRPGDSMATIFSRLRLDPADLQRLVDSAPHGNKLNNVFPGYKLRFEVGPQNEVTHLTFSSGPLDRVVFTRIGDAFESAEDHPQPNRVETYKSGEIYHSLFVASQRADLSDAMTMRLAKIFQWDIDFVLDIRKGDTFHVIYEEMHLDGQMVEHGNILAAEFVNQGERYRAVRYENDTGEGAYFDPDGNAMRKSFLRAPVSFTRVSSNFNLDRRHPLWKSKMPHRGVDYAAPTGTEILAAGDGQITTASSTAPNGNYIVLRHTDSFTTKYLHLSRFAKGIKKGVRVQQGQVIGYVGKTGWATGPHLHYEFLVDGVHKNPRTVALPRAKPVPADELPRFQAVTGPLLARLTRYQQDGQSDQLALGR